MAQKAAELVKRSPSSMGLRRTRWTLLLLVSALQLSITPKLLSKWLRRFRIRYKRARLHVHSPDTQYDAKKRYIKQLYERVKQSGQREVLLYLDEVTISTKPTLCRAWCLQGAAYQAYAELGHTSEKQWRVIGAINAFSGSVVGWVRGQIKAGTLREFLKMLRREHYPDAERIYVVIDNWPVHYHHRVLEVLEEQELPFGYKVPASWPAFDPSARTADPLPIQLVSLPTYASWLNPIEKLWRKLRQELTHLHAWADAPKSLRTAIERFLDGLLGSQPELLRYVGLDRGRALSLPLEHLEATM